MYYIYGDRKYAHRKNVHKKTQGLQHIFHIFTHFSTFFHPYHYISQTVAANYTIVKRKWGFPKTLLMDTLILNLKQFVSESSKKAVPQNIFQKLLYLKIFSKSCCISQHSDMKVLVRKNAEKRELSQ